MADSPITTTSFIPKTRLTGPTYRSRGFGLGLLICGFLLLISLGIFGGTYLYKKSLQTQINDAATSLERARKAFEPALISDLGRLTSSIDAAKALFVQHQATSKIFKLISNLTLKDVRFSNFNYKTADRNLGVTMEGEAKSYTDVALQAKLFENSDFVNQVRFSGLNLREAGKVSFNVEIIFKPSYLIYQP